ncbi:MAG: hypothetical protein CMM01_06740 [Rhodopirellula sp.]|nr:hypothetical protein [Rhodopirellula sp.]OUX51854.1 MAG: hypothetical protein CBE43_02105 [Rhodopirellula sp. TMED283]
MLAPDGQEWLSRASRGPQQVFGRSGATDALHRYALMYPAKADSKDALVQDFHSFRQALNVASADQRVLVLINAPADQEPKLRQALRPVANHASVIGRFHFDFEQGSEWKTKISGASKQPGIVLIHAGEFGMKGKVLKQLPLNAQKNEIIAAMQQANARFAATTELKVYSQHVAKGNRQGIYFEGAVPYGEDRDGDGEIDHRGGGRGGFGGRGTGGGSTR